MRSNTIWATGFAVLIASFSMTLWLTAPEDMPANSAPSLPATPLAIFTSFEVSDRAQLAAAAKSARLAPSDSVRSLLEELSARGKGQVMIRGWAIDSSGQGDRISIVVFVQGKLVFETETKGARADVAAQLKLSEAEGAHAQFEGIFSCAPGQPLLIVAVGAQNSYAQIAGPPVCPS